jgi:hypothetical protein
MARLRTGTLRRKRSSRGVSYGVQFSYRGESHYVHFGGSWEGWTEERGAAEQGYLMAKVNRGEWTPPPRHRAPTRPAQAATFQVVASEWLHRHKLKAGDPDGTSTTIRDLEWRLTVVMDKFGPVPVDRVDFALAEDLVAELCEERLAIERARELGEPLTEAYADPRTGRRHERRKRGLSNSSIRKALHAAERVLREARRRGIVAEVPELRAAAPKAERPSRSFLEPEQIAAVLLAADAIEAEHRGLMWDDVQRIRSSGPRPSPWRASSACPTR